MAKAEPIHGLHPEAPLAENAALIIRTRLEEMLEFAPCLADAEAVYTLHQMRIAAKRLRYTMELFQDLYAFSPDFAARFSAGLEVVKKMQDHLGLLHDADVLVPRLTEHLAGLLKKSFGRDHRNEPVVGVHFVDFDAGIGLLALCREMRFERDGHYAAFLADWNRWQEARVFPALLTLLEEAACPLPIALPAAPPEDKGMPTPAVPEVTARAEDPVQTDPPVHRAAPRRRRPLAPRSAPQAGGDPGPGADPPARPAEGGPG